MQNRTRQSPRQALALVFKSRGYFSLALLVAGLIFIVSLLIPYYSLLKWIFFFSDFSWLGKFSLLGSLLKSSLILNSTTVSLSLLAMVSLLSSVNIVLLVFYFKHRLKLFASVGTSLVAWLIAFLGIGCTACGAIILSSLFGLTTATLFISFLPLQGLEFSILAILLLILSVSLLIRQIQKQNSCKIKLIE